MKKTLTISYVHTPPRGFCDQWENNLTKFWAKIPFGLSPVLRPILNPVLEFFRQFVLTQFAQSLRATDHIIANSVNIKNRTEKFLQVPVNEVIWPAVNTTKFSFLGQKNYYHSHCRLESLKRIELIVEAFSLLPNKNLVITSTGPLAGWVQNEIKTKNLTNIDFRGRVSDEELVEIMGNCVAGIMIPVDEDAGITQIEFLSAGKPMIAVAEGGLLETICGESEAGTNFDKKATFESRNSSEKTNQNPKIQTGILIPKNPKVEDLINGIDKMTPELALTLRENCEKTAQNYDQKVFFTKLDKAIGLLVQ
jgi:glycosyltransferase involved in cell wall biosynthesis